MKYVQHIWQATHAKEKNAPGKVYAIIGHERRGSCVVIIVENQITGQRMERKLSSMWLLNK